MSFKMFKPNFGLSYYNFVTKLENFFYTSIECIGQDSYQIVMIDIALMFFFFQLLFVMLIMHAEYYC